MKITESPQNVAGLSSQITLPVFLLPKNFWGRKFPKYYIIGLRHKKVRTPL